MSGKLDVECRVKVWYYDACRALPIFVAVGMAHVALGLVLKLYFFQYWS